jgi:ribonuclease P protein component
VPVRTVGRIQSRAAFGQLQRSRLRASCGPVRASFVAVAPGVPGVFPQVGYAIGTQCGNAVVRNTLRRRARATARAVAPELPRGTYLLRFEPAAAQSPPAELTRCVGQALQRAAQAASTPRVTA